MSPTCSSQKHKNAALILAGGNGTRFGSETPKQFLKLRKRMILDYSLHTFLNHPQIHQVILVAPATWLKKLTFLYPKITIVEGGNTRKKSSMNGLNACDKDTQTVLIHDAARPFVSGEIINRVLDALNSYDAIAPTIASADTIYHVEDRSIIDIPHRNTLALAQTPQGFNYQMILKAHQTIEADASDDIRLAQMLGVKCSTVEGDGHNFKITRSLDMAMAETILDSR